MLKRKSTIIIFLSALFLFIGADGFAQKPGKQKSPKKQQQEFIKLQNNREKASDDALEADRSKHMKAQGKAARKRMKTNKKKMRRLQKGKHQDSFFKRLFRKKQRR